MLGRKYFYCSVRAKVWREGACNHWGSRKTAAIMIRILLAFSYPFRCLPLLQLRDMNFKLCNSLPLSVYISPDYLCVHITWFSCLPAPNCVVPLAVEGLLLCVCNVWGCDVLRVLDSLIVWAFYRHVVAFGFHNPASSLSPSLSLSLGWDNTRRDTTWMKKKKKQTTIR